jgi:diguanylate cyclase (GGDEF)-like protein
VVIFDLDRFKDVNDKHGHAAGDATLRQFAQILLTNTRKENLSARFGGEEFLSILRDSDADGAVVFAQRVLNQTRTKSFPSGTQTASAGIATYEDGMGSYELLLSAADRALYLAKDGGRDMVCVAQQVAPVGPVKRRPGAPPLPKPPEPAAPKPPGAKVYVVDDDTAVRNVMKRVLVGAGHDVWDTNDPREAIKQFAASSPAKRPDVILTDVIMPEMTGMTMIDRIAHIAPDVRVIYMSGYVQSKISYAGTPGNVVTFLEKPVNFESLLAAVAGVKPKTE